MLYHLKAEEKRPSALVYDNIIYANRITRWGRDYHPLKINLIIPHYDHKENPPAPLLVWLEGGGWRNASPAVRLAELGFYAYHGIAVADVEYSVNSNNIWPVCLEDVKEAIRFLRANRGEFNIDPEKLIVAGDSAGAHLAALTALTGDEEKYKTEANRQESDKVNGVICLYCPGDFPAVLGDPVPVCYEDLLTGEITAENEALLKEINPMSHVTKNVPPFLFFHGDADNVVYYRSSLNLYEKLLSAGAEADYYLLEGANHAENAFTQENIQELMLAFIRKHI